MDYEDAAKDLREIRAAMGSATTRASRESGWFFLIQGAVYLIGFSATQFAPAASGPLWVVLNVLAIGGTIALGALFGGKGARQKIPGLATRIVLISIGLLVFDAMLIFSFGLTAPRDFTLILVLSLGFCYFVIGLTTRQSMSVMGALVALLVFGANLLFPSYFYLATGICAGLPFVVYGAAVLVRKGPGR
jgi:hypothetical protein